MMITASCSVPLKISHWQSIIIKPDGIPNEYVTPLNYYDAGSKVQFTFSNDLENLYFCIRATEESPQLKILHAGFQIVIDTSRGQKRTAVLEFPILKQPNHGAPPTDNPYVKDGKPDMSNLLQSLNEMRLTGFNVPINGLVSLQNNYGIRLAIQFDADKNMTIEGVIPFKTFYSERLSEVDAGKIINISILINGMQAPPKLKDNNGAPMNQPPGEDGNGTMQGDRMPQGNNGMPPGGRGPQGERPQQGGFQSQNVSSYSYDKINSIKIKYSLSVKK